MRILDAHMLFMRLGSRFTYMLLWLLMHYCHTRLYYKSCQEMLWPSICANVAFCQLFCLLEYCAGRSIVATFYLNLMTEAHLYSIYLLIAIYYVLASQMVMWQFYFLFQDHWHWPDCTILHIWRSRHQLEFLISSYKRLLLVFHHHLVVRAFKSPKWEKTLFCVKRNRLTYLSIRFKK